MVAVRRIGGGSCRLLRKTEENGKEHGNYYNEVIWGLGSRV